MILCLIHSILRKVEICSQSNHGFENLIEPGSINKLIDLAHEQLEEMEAYDNRRRENQDIDTHIFNRE